MAVKKTAVKKTVKATTTKDTESTEEVKAVKADVKVKMLKTHFNAKGIFTAGETYTISSDIAEAYIKAGEAERC